MSAAAEILEDGGRVQILRYPVGQGLFFARFRWACSKRAPWGIAFEQRVSLAVPGLIKPTSEDTGRCWPTVGVAMEMSFDIAIPPFLSLLVVLSLVC